MLFRDGYVHFYACFDGARWWRAMHAAAILVRGGIVAFPMETVYGPGANAFDAAAVTRVFEVKGRLRFDPLIVYVAGVEQARSLASEFPKRALAEAFWLGRLTLVLPKRARLPEIVSAGLPTVGLRMPTHAVALALIRAARVPLAAPSANPFGGISPTTAGHVVARLGDRVDMVLVGGPCRVGVESTVLSLADGAPCLLWVGGVAVEDFERLVGRVLRPDADPLRPLAPADAAGFAAVEVLSVVRDLREAAAKLFAALHGLDALGLDAILFETVPQVALGLAIMDRLRRAARAAVPALTPEPESEALHGQP